MGIYNIWTREVTSLPSTIVFSAGTQQWVSLKEQQTAF